MITVVYAGRGPNGTAAYVIKRGRTLYRKPGGSFLMTFEEATELLASGERLVSS